MGRYFCLYGLGGSVGGPGTLECPLTNMRYNAPAKGAGEGSQTFRAWIAQLVIRPVSPVAGECGRGWGCPPSIQTIAKRFPATPGGCWSLTVAGRFGGSVGGRVTCHPTYRWAHAARVSQGGGGVQREIDTSLHPRKCLVT